MDGLPDATEGVVGLVGVAAVGALPGFLAWGVAQLLRHHGREDGDLLSQRVDAGVAGVGRGVRHDRLPHLVEVGLPARLAGVLATEAVDVVGHDLGQGREQGGGQDGVRPVPVRSLELVVDRRTW